MKTRFLFFSSALCMCMIPAFASDCVDANCDNGDVTYEFSAEYIDAGPVPEYVQDETITVNYGESNIVPMQNVKLLSIKPAPIDNRAPIWDGTNGKYKPQKHQKTVSWKSGVPIWDDSISDYRAKDFRDWMLEPLPEVYLRDGSDTELVELYNDTMDDATATRARIEELLAPNRPTENLWMDAQDMTTAISIAFNDDGCPFETETECNIWRRKPIIRETVSPRSPKLRDDKMIEFLSGLDCSGEIDANSTAAAPLVARYKMLMNSARACCTEGMTYSLRRAGASDGLVYKFMSDDANFYNIGNRCLMTTDAELDAQYGETATASVIADVRNGCLCRGREWFTAMLAPFVDAWNASPEFAASPFMWTYRDGLNRAVTVSINTDVRNVLNQLTQCP